MNNRSVESAASVSRPFGVCFIISVLGSFFQIFFFSNLFSSLPILPAPRLISSSLQSPFSSSFTPLTRVFCYLVILLFFFRFCCFRYFYFFVVFVFVIFYQFFVFRSLPITSISHFPFFLFVYVCKVFTSAKVCLCV